MASFILRNLQWFAGYWRKQGLITICVVLTVGQRKKVITVTFFPARPLLDQTAQIRAKYAKFAWIKSRDF